MKIQIGKPKNEEQPQNMACTFQNISVMKEKAEHLLPIKGAQRKRQLDAMCVPALEHESWGFLLFTVKVIIGTIGKM